MELILISNTKLKIMLSEEDMTQYNIGGETDCSEPTTRRAIRSLLECARDQIGFNTDGEEIFVQLYTSKRGGCELFVTKCKVEEPEIKKSLPETAPVQVERSGAERKAKKAGRLPSNSYSESNCSDTSSVGEEKKGSIRKSAVGRIAFSFPSLSELISICRLLDRFGIHPESRAFTDSDGRGYLLLMNTGMSAYSRLDRLTFILEYGQRENPDCVVSYISEHGKVICDEKAVETLCRF